MRKLTSRGKGTARGCGLQQLQGETGDFSPQGTVWKQKCRAAPPPQPWHIHHITHLAARAGRAPRPPTVSPKLPQQDLGLVFSLSGDSCSGDIVLQEQYILRGPHAKDAFIRTAQDRLSTVPEGLAPPQFPRPPGSSQDPRSELAAGRPSGPPQPPPAPEGRMGCENTAWHPRSSQPFTPEHQHSEQHPGGYRRAFHPGVSTR